MFRLQAVRQLLPPGDAAKSLDSAMQVGDQAFGEGRDAVQNMRSSSFDERDLVTSLSALGTEFATAIDSPSNPRYRVVVEGRLRALTAIVRGEAYRTREAVSNAYQHAKAGEIETEIAFGDADLTIRVRDDGIGVDPEVRAPGQRPGHWGLPGMRERCESFGGHLHIWSEGNAGSFGTARARCSSQYRPFNLKNLFMPVVRQRPGESGSSHLLACATYPSFVA